jgi:hypothetical protein
MLETKDLNFGQKRERMARPTGLGGQGCKRGPRCGFNVGVINHCERVNAKVDDILQGVIEAKGTQLYNHGGGIRLREPHIPAIQYGEKALNRNLAT